MALTALVMVAVAYAAVLQPIRQPNREESEEAFSQDGG